VNTFTVTASNTTAGEASTSAAQTLTVTDPPAFSDLFADSDLFAEPTIAGLFGHGTLPGNTAGDKAYDNALTLLGQANAQPFGGMTSDPTRFGSTDSMRPSLAINQPHLDLTQDHYSGLGLG
jgi:hypothetical protein